MKILHRDQRREMYVSEGRKKETRKETDDKVEVVVGEGSTKSIVVEIQEIISLAMSKARMSI